MVYSLNRLFSSWEFRGRHTQFEAEISKMSPEYHPHVIASEAKQSQSLALRLLRRWAPRNDMPELILLAALILVAGSVMLWPRAQDAQGMDMSTLSIVGGHKSGA